MRWPLWLSQVGIRLRALLRARRLDRELDEELAFHLDMAAEAAERRGLSPAEARRAARMALDGVVVRREECRDARGWAWLDALRQDTRHAARALRRAPVFTVVAIASLALGIGATGALFAVVDAVLVRPLPLPAAERLVWIEESRDGEIVGGTPDRLRDWAALAGVEAAGGFYGDEPLVRVGQGEARRIPVVRVVGGVFSALGLTPLVGRLPTSGEVERGEPVALLTETAWRRNWAARADAVGQVVTVEGRLVEITGVLPVSADALDTADLWMPAPDAVQRSPRTSGFLGQVARLRDGFSLDQARASFLAGAGGLAERHPGTDKGIRATLVLLQSHLGQGARLPLLTLFGAVLLVLLVACLNVAALSLARGLSRRRESSLRVALGAGMGRLLQLHLMESALIASGGVLLGIALAWWGLDALRAYLPPTPRLHEARLDARFLGFATALSCLGALIVGALPAIIAMRAAASPGMREGAPSIAGVTRSRWRGALVVVEVAAAVVLLIGASLLARSLAHVTTRPVGIDPARTLTFAIPLSWDTDPARIAAVTAAVLDRLDTHGAVGSAGMVDRLPLDGGTQSTAVAVRGRTLPDDLARRQVGWRTATRGYFTAVGIPVVRGALYDDRGGQGVPRVAVVNRTFARLFLGGQDPVGVEITGWRRGSEPAGPWTRIVGVVEDTAVDPADAGNRPEVFVPAGAAYWPLLHFAVRAHAEPATLATVIRGIAAGLGDDLAVEHLRTLDEHVAVATREPRTRTFTVVSFAVVALLLAALGLYGLLAGEVAARTQEFGVRLTLGARPRQILRQTLGRGLRLAVAGLGLGLAATPWLVRFIEGLLVGVGPSDALALVGAILVLLLTAVLACAGPAWRAARVDPRVALRHE